MPQAVSPRPRPTSFIVRQRDGLIKSIDNIQDQISQLTSDLRENEIVVETLSNVDPSRQVVRRVNGQIMERTAEEVLRTLRDEIAHLGSRISAHEEELEDKQIEVAELEEEYNFNQVDS